MAAGTLASGRMASGFRRLVRRKPVAIALIVLAAFALAALFAPWIAPYDPSKLSIANRLKPPSFAHLLGTDEFGRDILSRILYGGRMSLLAGAATVVLSSLIGLTLGLVSGFFRRLDTPIARLIDAMMAFPDILLAIALVAVIGPSLTTVIAALSIVYAPRLARIVRASTLVIRELPYIEASRAMGIRTHRILLRHVLGNLWSPVLVQGTFIFASAMLAEAGLSFLGLGVSPDIPTWGTMIAAGRSFIGTADWMTFFPGLAIVLCVLSLQLVGDGLRDLLDRRLSKEF